MISASPDVWDGLNRLWFTPVFDCINEMVRPNPYVEIEDFPKIFRSKYNYTEEQYQQLQYWARFNGPIQDMMYVDPDYFKDWNRDALGVSTLLEMCFSPSHWSAEAVINQFKLTYLGIVKAVPHNMWAQILSATNAYDADKLISLLNLAQSSTPLEAPNKS